MKSASLLKQWGYSEKNRSKYQHKKYGEKLKLFVPDSDTVKFPCSKFCFIVVVGPCVVSAFFTSTVLQNNILSISM